MDLGRMEIQRSGKSLAFSVIDSVMMVAHHYIKKKHAKVQHIKRQSSNEAIDRQVVPNTFLAAANT